jgi:predicted nucleic acid-binding protein
MVLVDSSVWIDYFNGADTPQANALDGLLGQDLVLMGDLILTEVLQGFRSDRDYRLACDLLAPLELRILGGREVALHAAEGYRALRARGVTVRKTIDMIIGSHCLLHALPLLHADRDFDALETHLGLTVYRAAPGSDATA